jgi:hypothetical protein
LPFCLLVLWTCNKSGLIWVLAVNASATSRAILADS